MNGGKVEIVWVLVIGLVGMLARMMGARRSSVVLVALPLVVAALPYLYALLTPGPWELGKGMIIFVGTPAAFLAGLLLSIAIYIWRA